MFDYEDNRVPASWFDSLIGTAGRVADIYRNVTQPAPSAPAPAPAPVRLVNTPVGAFSPWAIFGALLALGFGLWLLLRKP